MPESSIVIFADGPFQNRYRDLSSDKESLHIFAFAEASDIIERLKANVILIDCGLSAKRGLKLLKKIKTGRPQIPVIFLTDVSSEELAIAAFRSGAREYFANPVSHLVLRKTIERLVEIRKTTLGERVPFFPVSEAELNLTFGSDFQKAPPRFRAILLYINESLPERITLSSLAEQARVSKFHFIRDFRKYIGMSPMKYVNFIRIRRAKELLLRDNLTVSEIADQLGYGNLGSFIRSFRGITGVTPTQFRMRPRRDHCGRK